MVFVVDQEVSTEASLVEGSIDLDYTVLDTDTVVVDAAFGLDKPLQRHPWTTSLPASGKRGEEEGQSRGKREASEASLVSCLLLPFSLGSQWQSGQQTIISKRGDAVCQSECPVIS